MLKILERVSFVIHYDPEADILYVSFMGPKLTKGRDIGNGEILRIGLINKKE
jgi:uncharacterized protein YuzE